MERLSDPFRDPAGALASLKARVGSLSDKLKVAKLRRDVLAQEPDMSFRGGDRTTLAELQGLGFSPGFIDGFFRPFLGGVFLERALETSSLLFRYYFRCFSAGDATLPARGMQRLPELLAAPLEDRITLESPATAVSAKDVSLGGGATINADFVVVAVDGRSAATLFPDVPEVKFKSTVTSYFASEHLPLSGRRLILDGEGEGPANHVAVVSEVAPEYAPSGAHLISVSGVGAHARDEDGFRAGVRDQLARWFGPSVASWHHLKTYRIPDALPVHEPGSLTGRPGAGQRPDGVFVAGDYVEFGAIQGALRSGRKVAEAILDRR
ncbi:MAG: amine oxidase [Gemmatimonadetes bacterium]|nr:amine oxidase [Gemmatimonadota bacterium]